MPTVVLGTDADVDCFCAWVSAEQGLPEHAESGSDLKVCCFYPFECLIHRTKWEFRFFDYID